MNAAELSIILILIYLQNTIDCPTCLMFKLNWTKYRVSLKSALIICFSIRLQSTFIETPSVIYSSEVHISFGKSQTFITPRMIIYIIIKDCGVPTCQEREDKRGHPTGQGRVGGNCTVKVAVVVVAYDDDQRWNLPVDIVGDSCSLLETTSFSHTVSLVIFTSYLYFVMIQGVKKNIIVLLVFL